MVPLLTLLWLPALQSPWAQPAAAPAPPSAVAQCDRSRFHALLDVGHTAEAPGARSARGAREFEFNLRLAKEIDERLIEAGFEKTELLITEGLAHVPPDFEVYVGGVRQVPGRDFEVQGRSLVFPRPVAQEGRLGFWRWASMWLGIAGTYRKHESVDVVYEWDGRREVETGLRPEPYE